MSVPPSTRSRIEPAVVLLRGVRRALAESGLSHDDLDVLWTQAGARELALHRQLGASDRATTAQDRGVSTKTVDRATRDWGTSEAPVARAELARRIWAIIRDEGGRLTAAEAWDTWKSDGGSGNGADATRICEELVVQGKLARHDRGRLPPQYSVEGIAEVSWTPRSREEALEGVVRAMAEFSRAGHAHAEALVRGTLPWDGTAPGPEFTGSQVRKLTATCSVPSAEVRRRLLEALRTVLAGVDDGTGGSQFTLTMGLEFAETGGSR